MLIFNNQSDDNMNDNDIFFLIASSYSDKSDKEERKGFQSKSVVLVNLDPMIIL